MNIINRPVCINRALCSKSKSDKPNSFKWLHSNPRSSEYQTSLETCIPAAREGNKEPHTLLGWRLAYSDRDFLTTKVTLQMQPAIAAGPGLLCQSPRGKAICSGDREWHFSKGLHLSHHLCQQVSLSWLVQTLQDGRELPRSGTTTGLLSCPAEGKVPLLWAED